MVYPGMHVSAVMCLKSSFGRSIYSDCPGAVTGVLYHCVLSRTLCGWSLSPFHVTKDECLSKGQRQVRHLPGPVTFGHFQHQAVENSTFAKFPSCDDQSGCFSLLYPHFLSFAKSPPSAMYVNSGMLVSNTGLQNVKHFMPAADLFENT